MMKRAITYIMPLAVVAVYTVMMGKPLASRAMTSSQPSTRAS